MTPTDRLAALLHEPCVEAWNQIRLSDPKRQVTQHGPDAHSVLATRLIAAGVTLAATPAPLDEKSPQCECERRCPVHGDGTITFATPALVATLGRIR